MKGIYLTQEGKQEIEAKLKQITATKSYPKGVIIQPKQ
jgi:hypothetical protein